MIGPALLDASFIGLRESRGLRILRALVPFR